MPPIKPNPQAAPDFIPADAPDFIPATGTMQGESPNYGPGVTVMDPTWKQIGKGVLREGANLLSGAHNIGRKGLEMIPGVQNSQLGRVMDQHQEQLDTLAKPANLGEAFGKTGGEMASYLIPSKAETGALSAAERLPSILRPVARIAVPAISNATMSAMNRQDPVTGAVIGAGTGVIGEGLRSLAPALAESAVGIRNVDRTFGKRPGAVALEQTKGVRPETVAKSASGRIETLARDLESKIGVSNTPVSLLPARGELSGQMQGYASGNAIPQLERIRPLHEALTTTLEPHGGFPAGITPRRAPNAPIPDQVSPEEALALRRMIGDFQGERPWNGPAASDPIKQGVRRAYGAQTRELHRAVPGASEIDQSISSLIPFAQRAEATALNAPTTQRILNRIGAHTGAMTGAAAGAAMGAKAGLAGGVAGGALGLTVPELLASPTAKMALARVFNSPATSRTMRAVTTPALQRALDYIRATKRPSSQ